MAIEHVWYRIADGFIIVFSFHGVTTVKCTNIQLIAALGLLPGAGSPLGRYTFRAEGHYISIYSMLMPFSQSDISHPRCGSQNKFLCITPRVLPHRRETDGQL